MAKAEFLGSFSEELKTTVSFWEFLTFPKKVGQKKGQKRVKIIEKYPII